jgi:hypothetical protein
VFLAAPERRPRLGMRGTQDFSSGKHNLVSDFLQEIVVPTVPYWPPQSKSDSRWAGIKRRVDNTK